MWFRQSRDRPNPDHEYTVQRFRVEMMEVHETWSRLMQEMYAAEHPDAAAVPAAVAASQAYTIAAIIGQARELAGAGVAHKLALLAEGLLNDGDFEDLNADVTRTKK